MLGVMYVTLLPFIAYLTGNRDSVRALMLMSAILAIDIIITDFLYLTIGEHFFLFRAIVDLLLLLIVYSNYLIPIKRTLISLFVSTSLIINLYLCFELDNVFIYRHWELINLMLCELVFIALLISDKMFSHRIFTRK